METETTSIRFPNVLAYAKPQGVVGWYKIFRKDGNAIGLQRLVDSDKQANKKLKQELGGGLRIF